MSQQADVNRSTDELNQQLLTLAVDLTRLAGDLITAMRAEAVRAPDSKSSPTDPVTAADRAAEDLLVTGILSVRPDDGVRGEEGADAEGTSGVIWHIDPIDGTTNFVYGIPAYCVSVAAEVDGVITAGAVNNPVLGEVFAAARGQGATLNGDPITVSKTSELSMALVATGFAYRAETRSRQAAEVCRILPSIRDIRRSGSAALDLCAVAAGRVDAYYEAGLNKWDWAAGFLIATEAGARGDSSLGPNEMMMMANPAIYDDFVGLVVHP